MFMVAYGAQRGPRWASLGIVALIAYFFGLVTHDPPATLPMRLVVLFLAAGAAGLIRCLLLPERPQAELDRLRRAIHAGIVRVLDRYRRSRDRRQLDRPGTRGTSPDGLSSRRRGDAGAGARRCASRRIPGQASGWLHLLAIELGVERVARIALQDLGTPADRGPLVAILNALRQDAALPSVQFTGVLGGALALLARVMREAPQEGGPAPAAPPPPAGAAPGIRSALQTAVASALAIIAGDLVSPNRWYRAAFAAFVMFQGTRSRGESLIKGTQFIIGTLAGVFFGMLVATLLSGHEILTMGAIVAAVFLAFQANVAAYGAMVFWLTVILGLLFGMLGFFAPELLLLRLKEAAVGAACGAAVASLVLAAARACGGGRRDARLPAARWVSRWTAPLVGCSMAGQHRILAARILASRTALPRSERDCAVRTVGTGRGTR